MDKLTIKQNEAIEEKLTVMLEQLEYFSLAPASFMTWLNANTAEDEPIEPQMSHTQIAKQVYERYCDAMKPPIVAVISFPDWLQEEGDE